MGNLTRSSQGGGFNKTNNPVTQIGSVIALPNNITPQRTLSPFSVTLDNSAGGSAKDYIVGDPSGLVAAIIGGTWANPDSCSVGSTAAANTAFKESLGNRPVVVGQFNYSVATSATQFANPLKYYAATIDGDVITKNVPVSAAKRNNQFDAKLLTIESAFVLGEGYGLTLSVNASESVTFTFTPIAFFSQGGL